MGWKRGSRFWASRCAGSFIKERTLGKGGQAGGSVVTMGKTTQMPSTLSTSPGLGPSCGVETCQCHRAWPSLRWPWELQVVADNSHQSRPLVCLLGEGTLGHAPIIRQPRLSSF